MSFRLTTLDLLKSRYGREIMKKRLIQIALLSLIATGAAANDSSAQRCEQIREEIENQNGLLPSTNIELLREISVRQECHFSSAEVYRAAFGDKPLLSMTKWH
jgi:hypothetical protein